MGRGNLKLMRH